MEDDFKWPDPCIYCGRAHFTVKVCPKSKPRHVIKWSLEKRRYNSAHQWAGRTLKKKGKCKFCKKICKTQWSNKYHTYNRDKKDWRELCPKCHGKFDVGLRKMSKLISLCGVKTLD